MEYISEPNYRIRVKSDPSGIKALVYELSKCIDKGMSYSQLEEQLTDIENLKEPIQYTFGLHHRTYIDKDELLYIPNTSGSESKRFHHKIFKKFLDKAIDNIVEKKQ